MSDLAKTAGITALVVWFAAPVVAHAHLKSATPAVNGSVDGSPLLLNLTFSEAINLKFSGVTLTGPDKAKLATTGAMLMDKDTTLMVDVPEKLGAGTYTVDWHALAKDGHKTAGAYTFTVKP